MVLHGLLQAYMLLQGLQVCLQGVLLLALTRILKFLPVGVLTRLIPKLKVLTTVLK